MSFTTPSTSATKDTASARRWWHVENKDSAKRSPESTFAKPKTQRSPPGAVPCTKWTFKVFVNYDLQPNERVSITGACDQLGNWSPNDSKALERIDGEENVWSVSLDVPVNVDVYYRYFISANDPSSEEIHVRKWETHLEPRKFLASQDEAAGSSCYDTFGEVNGARKVDRGWLATETAVQFIFFKNPFLLKDRIKNKQLFVKVTPMNLGVSSGAQDMQAFLEESMSNDTHDTAGDQTPNFYFVDVSTLGGSAGTEDVEDRHSHFQPQGQFGKAYAPDDVLIFHVTVNEPENVAFLIDLYARKIDSEDTPIHFGYHYVLPNVLKHSEGVLDVPVTCPNRHRPLGMMHVEYLNINPFPGHQIMSLERSFVRYWNSKWTGLEIGHRGSGTSFKATDGNVIRENTIASLKKAAANGADMVEFDVQLSKDLVPVIYHDFRMYVSLKRKTTQDTTSNDMLELPMSELTLEQLKNLKVFHTEEGKRREPKFFDEDYEEHQPFPTLAHALDTIDEHVGFNVEIKWSQRLNDGSTEAMNRFDKNLYLDCILEVVYKHARNRRIVFSCFDADVVTMLRLKQNLYPVMFLTIGETAKYQPYYDPRCNSHRKAIEHAQAMELLGIVGHTEDLLRDQTQIKETIDEGLVIFCWGDDNNCADNIRLLKNLGLHAIIYDKMDTLSTKEKRENIFLLEARESQKVMLQNLQTEVAQQQQ